MKIELDFADPTLASRVPPHGWATNSQGRKLLWLPVLRLVHEASKSRKATDSPEISRGQWAEIRAFDQTTRHFCLSLRELARCVRLGSDPCIDSAGDEKLNLSMEASSPLPLHLDLSFVYARRLADHFARAIRHVLFKHPDSVTREYKSLRRVVADPMKLRKLEIICDGTLLQEAFQRHSGWFDMLRSSSDENGELRKGIRDIMEHHPIAVMVHHSKVGDGPWEVIANLGDPFNASFRSDLILNLKEIVAGMAALWTSVCAAAGLAPVSPLWVAPYGDAVLLTGAYDDSTAFWPEITG